MGPISSTPIALDAIRYAEQKAGEKIIIIDTPGMNVDDTPAARKEAEAVVRHSAEIGSTFCLIHHASMERRAPNVEGRSSPVKQQVLGHH